MIKIKKSPLIYRSVIEVTAEFEHLMFDPKQFNSYVRSESIKALKVPKNTLRIFFKDKQSGFNGNGFARGVKSHVFTYNILTFKR